MNTATQHNTVTPKQAQSQGFVPVTTPYAESEEWMLEKAIANLIGTAFVLVATGLGIEIWRKRTDVKFTNGAKQYW